MKNEVKLTELRGVAAFNKTETRAELYDSLLYSSTYDYRASESLDLKSNGIVDSNREF